MTGKPWFRLYAEFASDPKVQLLSFENQRHFVMVLCFKCNGTLDAVADNAYRERMIAKSLGLNGAATAKVKSALLKIGVIDKNWQPTAWERRQYESDSSAARTHKWRERKRAERHTERLGDVTPEVGDVTVTDKSRTEQSRAEQIGGRAARIPTDFELTLERRKVAQAEHLDPERTFAKFCDHWRAASGGKARKLDWDATWRNWCRNESDWRPNGKANGHAGEHEARDKLIRSNWNAFPQYRNDLQMMAKLSKCNVEDVQRITGSMQS
jgi:hypothetical protein